MYPLKTYHIAQGVSFHTLEQPQFKTNRICVNIMPKLDWETASVYALIPGLLKQGCESYPNMTALNRRLQELYGANLYDSVRKLGDSQVLGLTLSVLDDRFSLEASSLSEKAVSLLCDVLFHPVLEKDQFREADVALQRQNLIDLIESQMNDKRLYAIDQMNELMFAGQPSGCDIYGTIQAAKQITAESATEAYQTLLKSAAIDIFWIGPGKSDVAKQAFADAFTGVPRDSVEKLTPGIYSGAAKRKEKVETMAVAQSKLVMGFANADTDDNAVRLMTALFGGTPTSKLFVNVRERLSLCYYCAARYDRIKNVVMVDSGVEHPNVGKAREEILKQLQSVAQGDFNQEDLEFARLSLINQYRTVGDSQSGLESWYLAQVCMKAQQTPQQGIEQLQQVTTLQVQEAAQKTTLDTVYVLTGKGDPEDA